MCPVLSFDYPGLQAVASVAVFRLGRAALQVVLKYGLKGKSSLESLYPLGRHQYIVL
jgi:hypothetical protein